MLIQLENELRTKLNVYKETQLKGEGFLFDLNRNSIVQQPREKF